MQYYINPGFFTEYSRSLIDKVNKWMCSSH
jgi:hypothetical protein